MQNKMISIIIPIYNESPNIAHLHRAVASAISNVPHSFEFLFVDDGSSDDSLKRLKQIARKDKRARVIELARNFGKEIAVTAGLHRARGDAAIIMDADLQHPPKLLPEFINEWEKGADVVVGVKEYTNDTAWFKRVTSRGFYAILDKVSQTSITPHASDFRLINRKVIDTFKQFTERNRMTRGLIDWSGFNRRYIHFKVPPRQYGEAGYTYRQLFRLAINSFTAYSMLPLKFAGWLGWFILFSSSILGGFVFVEKYLLGDPMNLQIRGTAILAIILLFMVGVVLVCLGFVALYIARIHDEVTNRPLYIVRNDTGEEL
jgi:dolichol-phosphate mannosyltransferase